MTPSPWLLPEDGIIDPIAVELAATGARLVALTPAERRLAAVRILAAGCGARQIGDRLGMTPRRARALAETLRTEAARLLFDRLTAELEAA
jgi:DNA-binding CsgD family transcriptional regulator